MTDEAFERSISRAARGMRPGDQVMTPAGPGEVVTLRTRYVWTGLHTVARGFVAVHLESDYGVRVFPAALVKPVKED